MSALLEINNLFIQRNGSPVLEVQHLAVESGSVLAIVGPNGAGKSTLLLALARLVHPERGEILFDGRPITSQPATQYRRRLALVMQDPLLFDKTVLANVTLGLRFRGLSQAEIDARAQTWMDRLGIRHLKNRRALQLSGGEAQRVSLARALVLDPELLLLDEPFSALDPPTRQQLIADLEPILRGQHMTTLFVTHDLDEACRLADGMAILLNGQLKQTGRPEDIFKAPASAEIAAFIASGRYGGNGNGKGSIKS
jgi:ABC-type sugar transport system ATPase subunit